MDAPLEVDVATAAQMFRDGALLLDVREPVEVAICHIAGSKLIPMRQIPESIGELPDGRPILVLCHHGHRSLHVTHFLRGHGFNRASNITGGIDAWAQEVDPQLARY